jgi:hypothetical protein
MPFSSSPKFSSAEDFTQITLEPEVEFDWENELYGNNTENSIVIPGTADDELRSRSESVTSFQSIDFGSEVDEREASRRRELEDESKELSEEETIERARIATEIERFLAIQSATLSDSIVKKDTIER